MTRHTQACTDLRKATQYIIQALQIDETTLHMNMMRHKQACVDLEKATQFIIQVLQEEVGTNQQLRVLIRCLEEKGAETGQRLTEQVEANKQLKMKIDEQQKHLESKNNLRTQANQRCLSPSSPLQSGQLSAPEEPQVCSEQLISPDDQKPAVLPAHRCSPAYTSVDGPLDVHNQSLPVLPDTEDYLYCSTAQITSLQTSSAQITSLQTSSSQITGLQPSHIAQMWPDVPFSGIKQEGDVDGPNPLVSPDAGNLSALGSLVDVYNPSQLVFPNTCNLSLPISAGTLQRAPFSSGIEEENDVSSDICNLGQMATSDSDNLSTLVSDDAQMLPGSSGSGIKVELDDDDAGGGDDGGDEHGDYLVDRRDLHTDCVSSTADVKTEIQAQGANMTPALGSEVDPPSLMSRYQLKRLSVVLVDCAGTQTGRVKEKTTDMGGEPTASVKEEEETDISGDESDTTAKEQYPSRQCPQSFKLDQQQHIHTAEEQNVIFQCPKRFTQQQQQHIHSAEMEYSSLQSPERFTLSQQQHKHSTEVNDSIFQCPKRFTLEQQQHIHSTEMEYSSLQSPESFTLKQQQHIRTVEEQSTSLQCPESFPLEQQTIHIGVCGRSFLLKEQPIEHLHTHTNDSQYHCIQCGNSFSCMVMFKSHPCSLTGERPYHCIQCGNSFSSLDLLQTHPCTHTGERAFPCTYCGKIFARSCNLKRHERIHTGELPLYHCTQCGKSFTYSENLKRHERAHTGERPYECTQCGANFMRSSHLTRHQLSHSGERMHRCTQCGKSFIRKAHLKGHMRIHTGQKLQ